jgi:hypothetical protein
MAMLESSEISAFDYGIVCHAEVDLPAWLQQLTGKSGWRLLDDEEAEVCDIYTFRRETEEAEVILYHTGYAMVDVNDHNLYDGHLTSAPGYARLQYYNAESGEPVLLN